MLYSHIVHSKIENLRKYQSGYPAERIHRDSEAVAEFLRSSIPGLFENVLIFIVGVVILYHFSPKLTIVSYALLPLYGITMKLWSKEIYEKQREFREARSLAYSKANLIFGNLVFLKSLGNYKLLFEKYKQNSEKLYRDQQRTLHTSFIASLSVQIIAFFAPVIVTVYGAYEVIQSHLTIGGLVAFSSFLSYLFNPVKNFVNINILYQKGKSSIDKIVELLTIPKEENAKKSILIPYRSPAIRFEDVSFYYQKDRYVLKDFSLSVPGGGMAIIEGPSGAGKSTLFLLIMKFYKPVKGRILINNQDIEEIPAEVLRRRIGYVPQNPVVLPGTIYDNLKMSNPDANEQDIRWALKTACCDCVWELEKGVYAETNELVKSFSGGELARINLAMALVKRPSILLLDEITAHLDASTRKCVIENVLSFVRDHEITTLWITHGSAGEISEIGEVYNLDRHLIRV